MINKKTCRIPIRYIIAGLVLLCTVNLYMCRINLSIAIVAMSKFNKSSSSAGSDVCDATTDGHNNSTRTTNNGEFDWDESRQSEILGAFFYGYLVFQVIGGRLAEIFGAKWLISGGMIASIVVNALTPLIARCGYYWLLLASRVVLGMFQAFIFPSTYALFAKWAPDSEISTMLTFPPIGANIGSIATTALSGYLAQHGFAGGWPSVFYMSAIIATVWLVIWIIFVKSEPKDHPWISTEELDYIQLNNKSYSTDNLDKKTKLPVPWIKIFTSIPVIAIIITKFTMNWIYIVLVLKLPSYFQSVFHYPVDKNGLIVSLIYIVLTLSIFGNGFFADYILGKQIISKTRLRKVFESIAIFGSSICLAAIPLAQCNNTLVLALLFIGMVFYGFYSGGDIPVISDMTSNYTATVFAITNTVAYICGFITPMIIAAVVEADTHNPRHQWGYVFYMSAAINAFGGVVFVVFGSADRQEWDRETSHEVIADTGKSCRLRDTTTGTDGSVNRL